MPENPLRSLFPHSLSPFFSLVWPHVCSSSFPNPLSSSKPPPRPRWISRIFITSLLVLSFSSIETARCCKFTPPAGPDPSMVPHHYRTTRNAPASQAKHTSTYLQRDSAHPRTALWLLKMRSHQTPSNLLSLSSPNQLKTTAAASWCPEVLSHNPALPRWPHHLSEMLSSYVPSAAESNGDTPGPSWPSSSPVWSAGSLLTFPMMIHFQLCLLQVNNN